MSEVSRVEDKAIVPTPDSAALATMSPEQIDRMVETVDKVAEARQRMIQACLRRAEADDFIDFDGKPYLEGEGAQRIASTVGIQLGRPEIDIRWEGDDCFVDVVVEAHWPATGMRVVELGACSTRDKFFSGRDGESATFGKELARCNGNRKLACQVFQGNIKKKALANATSRAVCAVMGIKGLTWDRLNELGFAKDRAGAQVKFKKGSAGGPPPAATRPAPAPKARTNAPAATEVPLYELGNQEVGAFVCTGGTISQFKEETPKTKTLTRVWISGQDPDAQWVEVKMSVWGNAPDWCADGVQVLIGKLEVKEFKGEIQFEIKEWGPVE